jgi:DNA-binding HxlR family transcriptional regulator
MAAMTDEIKVYDKDYPTRRLLELVGDKWTPIIVYILGQGTKRYGELRRHLPDVSKKMLTQTLRSLERDGLLKRKVYAEVPPRVDYDLTPLGQAFLEPITSLCAWAQAHQSDLEVAHSKRKRDAQRSKESIERRRVGP